MKKVANLVLARKGLGTIRIAGKAVRLSVATKTSRWNRPESVAGSFGESLSGAMSNDKNKLLERTAEVCLR